jgi:hypothetical protein
VLCGEIHAHNTLSNPEAVRPVDLKVEGKHHQVHLTLPPAFVAVVEIHLQQA